MTNKISTTNVTADELLFIQQNRLFTMIARQIATTRSQGKKHVSSRYVKQVLRAEIDTISETTEAIKNVAKQTVSSLKVTEL